MKGTIPAKYRNYIQGMTGAFYRRNMRKAFRENPVEMAEIMDGMIERKRKRDLRLG